MEDAAASLLSILQDLLGDRKRSAEVVEEAEAVKRPRVADEWLGTRAGCLMHLVHRKI